MPPKALNQGLPTELPIDQIICGDALEVLKTFPDECVDCIVTSPPYFGLRDYGITGQYGQEKTLAEYLEKMLAITAELKRALKPTGTLWWNHGDSYGTKSGGMEQLLHRTETQYGAIKYKAGTYGVEQNRDKGVPEKSLLLQNFRLAQRMIDEQKWILRNVLVWWKPNVMPSSVEDRFTIDYEPIFFFTKSKKYWFEQQYESYAPTSDVRYRQALRAGRSYTTKAPYKTNTPYAHPKKQDLTGNPTYTGFNARYKRGQGSIASRGDDVDGLVVGGTNPNGRNMRTVMRMPTKPLRIAERIVDEHIATFPEDLIIPFIKAGCPVDGIVLDPFCGSGTTLLAARNLNRHYIGIELSPKYVKLSERRLAQPKLL